MTPAVSIVTPLFDGAAFLPAHIASVQAQEMGDYEHLIVDNLSADDGPAMTRQAAQSDPRIRLLEQHDKRCPAATRNAGIAAARKDKVAI